MPAETTLRAKTSGGVKIAVNLNEWREKYPDIDDKVMRDWLTDMTLNEIPPDEQQAFIKKRHQSFTGQLKKAESSEEESDPEKEDIEEESDPEDENLPFEEQVQKVVERERHIPNEPDIPYDNPDLSDMEVPDDEPEEEEDLDEEGLFPEEEVDEDKTPYFPQEMITRTVSYQEYEQIIKPFKPVIDDIKKDANALNRFAAQIDERNLPPYLQIKPYIINHDLKDANNTQVLLRIISEANARAIEQKYLPITQAVDVTRTLAEQAWFEAALNNYDVIIEKLFEDRRALVSLIYILENYCETRQVSPFELSIPKKILVDTIEESFRNIKKLITENVIKEMGLLRSDLQGEMVDVGELVAKNMGRFDTQIQDAVTKVMWKVKTDVESTNMEDIKKSLLWLLNKRSNSYSLGGTATAIMGVMLDDLERQLLESGFKLELIKEHRKYTIEELSRKLGYKSNSLVIRTIPNLFERKLIKMYQNKTFSL